MNIEIDSEVLRNMVESAYRYDHDDDNVGVCAACGSPLYGNHQPGCSVNHAIDLLHQAGLTARVGG